MAMQIGAQRAPREEPVASGVAPVPFHVAASLLTGLNQEQRKAVKHGSGPLLVMAGPGTGKTEVVTRRVAWLIATKRARPREILALTFTDNAAEEMQARVDVLVPYGQADAAVHTFHAFGDRLIREFAFELGLPGDARLINRAEAIVLLREHMFELGLDRYRPLGDPTRFLGALVDLFHRAKDEDVSAEQLQAFVEGGAAADVDAEVLASRRELANAFRAYTHLMEERGLIDHGDQIVLSLRLLRDHSALRDEIARRYRYVLVDEFQDMNSSQLEVIRHLAADTGNVTAVGDPDQAIYTFRGAAADNSAWFHSTFPGSEQILLRRNYRSCQGILDSAARLVSHDPGSVGGREPLVADRRGRRSASVRTMCFASPDEEADGVAEAISSAVESGARPSEFCVLARSNGEVEPLARALRARGLPVRTQLPADFFAKPLVRPLLAYLRVVASPENTLELYALATSRIYELGNEDLTLLLAEARSRHISLWQALAVAAEDGASPRSAFARSAARLVSDVRAGIATSHERASTEVLYEHIRRSGLLASLAQAGDPADARDVAKFFEIVRNRARLLPLDRVASLVPHLDAVIEAQDDASETGPLDLDAVAVLTVHRAKGLEFDSVYLTGLVDGRFPARARPAMLDLPWADIRGAGAVEPDRLSEERRLFYVAMTRARNQLWLTFHETATSRRVTRRPSPFIAEATDGPHAVRATELDPMALIQALGTAAANPVEVATADDAPRAAFSFSELEAYLDCPERYRLRHVVGLPSARHHALAYGRAMHQAVAAFHLSRRAGKPFTEEQLLAVFQREWTPEGFLSREHEEHRYAQGRTSLLRFREEQLSQNDTVVAVERPFTVNLDGINIKGRIDRMDRTAEGTTIVDYKSSDVRDAEKANTRARDSLQLKAYAMAFESETGSLPAQMQLHFLDSGVVGTASPDRKRLDKARSQLKSAAIGIRDGQFQPKPDAVTCGYCPYRQICGSSAA